MLCVLISVFVKKGVNRDHGSQDRLVRSSCILACRYPPKPRRLRNLNGHFAFFQNPRKSTPLDRPPLFNPNQWTQSVQFFLRQLVRPDNQCFQLREQVQIPH